MNRSTLFWGFVLILAGAFFLLDNLGLLPVDLGSIIWPLVIILLGLWLLFGVFFRPEPQSEHVAVPLEGARRARVRVRHGAGRLQINSGAGPNSLAEGDFNGGLNLNKRRDGDLLDVEMSVPAQFFPFPWVGRTWLDWSFGLNPEIPLTLVLETGANESQLDLRQLKIHELSVNSGASSTKLILPENAGQVRAAVKTGAASVDVRIPEGVAARIHASGGLSEIRVDRTRFPRDGGVYQSPDYDSAENRVDLRVETGVGEITIG